MNDNNMQVNRLNNNVGTNIPPEAPKKGKSVLPLIIVAILLILIVVVVVILLNNDNNTNKDNTTTTNPNTIERGPNKENNTEKISTPTEESKSKPSSEEAAKAKKDFVEFATNILKDAQTQFVYDKELGNFEGNKLFVYDISCDLSITSIGQYKGYIVVDYLDGTKAKYILYLSNGEYMLLGHNYTESGFPTEGDIREFVNTEVDETMDVPLTACKNYYKFKYFKDNPTCYNRNDYKILG